MSPTVLFKFSFVVFASLELVNTLSTHPLLLIVAFDGFRHDFFSKHSTPGLNKFKTDGTYAPHMHNVFPTKTFPNLHSIATGLFTESHGVLGNEVYDPVLKRVLNFSPEMYNIAGITPIWTLNQLAARDRYSGIMMWPGGGFSFRNTVPKFHLAWNMSVTWETRVDTVIEWFKHSKTPANLVMLYFEEPDTTAHVFGPESSHVSKYIEKVDNITKYIREQIVKHNLLNKVNTILLSDHGMETVIPERIYNLTQYVNKDFFQITDSSPVLQIRPKKGKENIVYKSLKDASRTANFSIYQSSEFPTRWHYRQNVRTPPLLAVADPGYGFQDLIEWYEVLLLNKTNKALPPITTLGVHGYDNTEPRMWPFFIATGPVIKAGQKIEPFNTVDLYPLFSKILNIVPEPNNGTFSNVKKILKSSVA